MEGKLVEVNHNLSVTSKRIWRIQVTFMIVLLLAVNEIK